MPRSGQIIQNSLVQGLFTEASPTNYPQGGTLRDENFILNTDGSRQRRFGLGRESGAVDIFSNIFSNTVFTFDWEAVGNDGDLNFSVIVRSTNIEIYNKNVGILSDGLVYQATLAFSRGPDVISGTSINGKFVLVGKALGEVAIFSYDAGTNTVSVKNAFIKVRDIWGVEEEQDTDVRPETLTARHAYNLANQGWKFRLALAVRNVGIESDTYIDPATGEPITTTTDNGAWPSNADVVTYGLSETDTADRFKEELYKEVPFGTTPAPKGAAVVRLTSMTQDRFDFAVKQGYEDYAEKGLYTDYVYAGPKAVATYAGRVFFAGIPNDGFQVNDTYPNLNGTIVFSQSVQNDSDITKCYQAADPTTLDGDIVESDGGSITISGSGYIYKLISTGRSLLVFASEGVWELYSTDQLFSANNYQLRKLTNIGCNSPRSVILVENTPMYWTNHGIYAMTPNEVSESFVPQNITSDSIQSFFDEIDSAAIAQAVGYYDRFEKKARWLYSSTGDVTKYDTELVFDIRLKSWYTNVLYIPTGYNVNGYVSLDSYSKANVTFNIVAGTDNVIAGTDNVVTTEEVAERGRRSFKYVVQKQDGLDPTSNLSSTEFYEYNQSTFKDFGELDAEAVMITGPYTGAFGQGAGTSTRRKNATYLVMQFRKTETGFVRDAKGDLVPENPSSCIVETRWDYTDLAKAGKFNAPIEMYRHKRVYFPTGINDEYDDGQTVVTTKSKLRGAGKALALKITSSPEKDLDMLAWDITLQESLKV